MVRQLIGFVHEESGERGDGTRQRLLLPAVRLVTPVEEAVQEVRTCLEHVLVEPFGNLLDVLAYYRQRCLDDRRRGV